MDEITKALGPWPVLQFMFGAIILLGGTLVVFKGISNSKKSDAVQVDDQREKWEAYNQLENIEQNTFKILEQQRTMIDLTRQLLHAINGTNDVFRQLRDALWNRSQP